jgi:hypothetical protein
MMSRTTPRMSSGVIIALAPIWIDRVRNVAGLHLSSSIVAYLTRKKRKT